MAGEFGGGFRIGIVGLVAGIARFFGGFSGITAKDILRNIAYLKDQTVLLETGHVGVFWSLGRALAGALQTFAVYVRDHAKTFLKWAGDKLRKIEQYLKTKFGPILHYLKVLKDHIHEIYNRFVKPVIDTIEFIRALNRTLNVFHIHVLDKLDRILQGIERRIEEPFDWADRILTEIQNAIDRIITLDGLIQRFTLLTSMQRYAPAWVNGFWNGQIDANKLRRSNEIPLGVYPLDPPDAAGRDLGQFYRGDASEMKNDVGDLVQLWREATGIPNAGRT